MEAGKYIGAPQNPDGTQMAPHPFFYDSVDDTLEVWNVVAESVGAYRRAWCIAIGSIVSEHPASALRKYSCLVRGIVVSSLMGDPYIVYH